MPKRLGTWEVSTSFPLGLFGNPNPMNKRTNKLTVVDCVLLPHVLPDSAAIWKHGKAGQAKKGFIQKNSQ